MTFPDYQTTGTITVTGLCDPAALYNALVSESIVSFEFENGVESELQTFLMNAAGHFFVAKILNEDVRFEGLSPIDLFYSDSISEGDTITLGSNVTGYIFRTYGTQWSGELVNTITQCFTYSTTLGTFAGKLNNNGGIIASNINASAGVPVHIPVQWYSKYRNEPYETTFDITVSES